MIGKTILHYHGGSRSAAGPRIGRIRLSPDKILEELGRGGHHAAARQALSRFHPEYGGKT